MDIISPIRIYEKITAKTGIRYTNITNREISSFIIASYQSRVAIKLGNNTNRNIANQVSIDTFIITFRGLSNDDIMLNIIKPTNELNPNICKGFFFSKPFLVIILEIA
jgi:hypothetical protein